MAHIGSRADIACRSGNIQRDVSVCNALQRLSVALCKGNAHSIRVGEQKPGQSFLCGGVNVNVNVKLTCHILKLQDLDNPD